METLIALTYLLYCVGVWWATVVYPPVGIHHHSSCWAVNWFHWLWIGQMWRVSYHFCSAVQCPAGAVSLGLYGPQCCCTQETQGIHFLQILCFCNSV